MHGCVQKTKKNPCKAVFKKTCLAMFKLRRMSPCRNFSWSKQHRLNNAVKTWLQQHSFICFLKCLLQRFQKVQNVTAWITVRYSIHRKISSLCCFQPVRPHSSYTMSDTTQLESLIYSTSKLKHVITIFSHVSIRNLLLSLVSLMYPIWKIKDVVNFLSHIRILSLERTVFRIQTVTSLKRTLKTFFWYF